MKRIRSIFAGLALLASVFMPGIQSAHAAYGNCDLPYNNVWAGQWDPDRSANDYGVQGYMER